MVILIALLGMALPSWQETVCRTPTTDCHEETHVVFRDIDYNLQANGVWVVCEWAPHCGPYRLTWSGALRSMFDPRMGDDERLGA